MGLTNTVILAEVVHYGQSEATALLLIGIYLAISIGALKYPSIVTMTGWVFTTFFLISSLAIGTSIIPFFLSAVITTLLVMTGVLMYD